MSPEYKKKLLELLATKSSTSIAKALTIEELQRIAQRIGVSARGTRKEISERIIEYARNNSNGGRL